MFKKILIANRGEIAVRILRACREMGIKTVAVHSTADENSMHVRFADEAICIGGPSSKDSYLNIQNIISSADITGADAIHPGVGFLAESAQFARMVQEHGMTFIGPTPEHIDVMGDKISAKKAMISLGIPTVPGSPGDVPTEEDAMRLGEEIGFPLIVKATAGGGGKGMKVAHSREELKEAYSMAKREGKLNFGNDSVYMERYLAKPRHIEVQILADSHGNVIHLGERDCSLQRRHQKVFEEAPSPGLSVEEREKIGDIVIKAIEKLGYQGAGTLEFLYENGEFFFIEMNTRLQVEHPISEMITGINLVQEQIKVAAGMKLPFSQKDIKFKGHAIECRINAEHPETFIPSPGKITGYYVPGGWGVRVDSHLYQGYTIPPYYDSLVGKLIVYGDNREECIARTARALHEYVIDGIETLIPLHKDLVEQDDIKSGDYDIHWLHKYLDKKFE